MDLRTIQLLEYCVFDDFSQHRFSTSRSLFVLFFTAFSHSFSFFLSFSLSFTLSLSFSLYIPRFFINAE